MHPRDSPFIVFWELTRACMLACKHCRAKAIRKRNPDELDTDECFKLIDQLSEFNPKPLLIITGGDPMMRDDLEEIVGYAANNFRVAIAFSGTDKANKKRLSRLKDEGIARIAISIDGSNAEVHDSFRGIKGTFDVSMKILEIAKELGIPFQINTTVTKHNIEDLPDVAKLCLDRGAVLWDVFFVVPTGRANAELMPSPQEFEDILCWLYDLSKLTGLNVKSSAATHLRRVELMRDNGIMPDVGDLYLRLKSKIEVFPRGEARQIVAGGHGRSMADGIRRAVGITDGRGMFFISHIGEIYPSGFLPVVAGNVREKSPREIYEKSRVFVELKNPENLKGKCGICEYRFICGGSRARAYALTGDYLAPEPCCVYYPQKSK